MLIRAYTAHRRRERATSSARTRSDRAQQPRRESAKIAARQETLMLARDFTTMFADMTFLPPPRWREPIHLQLTPVRQTAQQLLMLARCLMLV